jgi:hypothetical protein
VYKGLPSGVSDTVVSFSFRYHAGKHRQDDPFALMEKHHIETEKLQILRNVDNYKVERMPLFIADPT